MRILVINYEYPPIGGGGGLVTRDIFEHIAAMGHQVTVVTSHFHGLARYEIANGVELIRVPVFFRRKTEVANIPSMISYVPFCIAAALRTRGHVRFHVINTHFAIPSGPAGSFAARRLGLPNILTIHGGDLFDPSKFLSPHKTPVLHRLVRSILMSSDRIVAQSQDTRDNAKTFFNIEKEIDIVPLGIKKPLYNRKKRVDFGLLEDEIVFCTIGRLIRRKNLADALLVMDRLSREYKIKFLIIGDGPDREGLKDLASNLNLSDKVRFLGSVSDESKFQILDVSDFYLSTALHEGFGLVFLEAMECGLPVICYDQGGQKDFLKPGKTGYLVEKGDRPGLHDRIVYLIRHPDLQRSIRAYNRKYVENFYIERCAEKYLNIFKSEIKARAGIR